MKRRSPISPKSNPSAKFNVFLTKEKSSIKSLASHHYEIILKKCLSLVPKNLQKLAAPVELQLVQSKTIQKLNKIYRGINKPTDVLSFTTAKSHLLGSIVIDVNTAKNQARDYGHSLQREIDELFVHGVFHLLGFDHVKPSDAKIMHHFERKLEKFLDRHDHS